MTIIPENLVIHKPDEILEKKLEENELEEQILAKIDSAFHSISIVENNIGRFLKYDETYQAGYINSKDYTGNLPYINYFLIPYLMNNKIKDILLIGLGSGILANQYEELFTNLKTFDIVDIEENIFNIAKDYFDFKPSEKINFYLQDAIAFLNGRKKKYDLIVVDVAGDEGIDERFCTKEYLKLIKKHLKKNGIFVSNMPSSCDIFNPQNTFALDLINSYKEQFANIDIYNGMTSNKIYYKTFFNVESVVYDITNLILISSDKKYSIEKNDNLKKIVDITPFLADKVG